MNEQDDSRFKIRLDEDDAGEDSMLDGRLYKRPVKKPYERAGKKPDKKFEDIGDEGLIKLNRRVTVIAVVIPLIMIVLAAFIYTDIQKKVFDVSNKGDNRVQDISNTLESSLSAESTKLKEMINTETLDIKNKSNSLAKKIDTNIVALKKLSRETATLTKTSKESKAIEKSVSNINEKMDKVEADLKKAKAEIQAFHTETSEKIAKLDDMMGNTFEVLQKLKTDMVFLKENQKAQIDEQALNNALNKQQEKYRKEIQEIKNEFSEKINDVERSDSSIKTPPVKKSLDEPASDQDTVTEQDISG